jgi:hypothetical protein
MLVEENKNERNVIILGDMNTEDILIQCDYEQLIKNSTTCEGTIIDKIYTRLADFDTEEYVLYKSFEESYHHPILVNLTPKH